MTKDWGDYLIHQILDIHASLSMSKSLSPNGCRGG